MRIAVGKSGLFWTFFEPFFQTFIFIGIHVFIAQQAGHSITSYNYSVFMASGFIAFNMFKNILNSATGAFKANRGLFIYKQVKPVDTIIARILVVVFLSVIIIGVFLVIGFFFHIDNLLPKNILMVIFAYVWLILFSFGIGLLVAIGNTFFVSIGKFIGMISFVLLIFSAIFFSVASLPPIAQQIILYNPLVHFMEMIHGYYVYGLNDYFVSYRYMLMWTVVPLFLGIWFYEKLEKRIVSE